MFTRIAISIVLLVLPGCTSPRGMSRPSARPIEQSIGQAVVSLHRLPGVIVPVKQGGQTLRSVISEARDRHALGTVEKFALNNKRVMESVVGPFDGNDPARQQVGDEVIVIIRGPLHVFVPSIVVQETVAGMIRILPGDVVTSIPVSIAKEWPIDETGQNAHAPDGPGTIRVGGPYFAAQELTLESSNHSLDDILALDQWATHGWGENPEIADTPLPPNIISLTRMTPASIEQFILPCGNLNDTVQNDTFDGDDDQINRLHSLRVQDGDVIEITRLELIPLIAAGALQPIVPECIPMDRTGSSKPRHRSGLREFSTHHLCRGT